MYLKSIEMQGFKSFPERTIIDFASGMTAIVGPNGSGKSNLTDAIRWVLGEQSVKTLRGTKMDDLIFSGTTTRRPLGFAEVTITFDNSQGDLPIEYREVAVTRRVYRSGESEYLLNNNQCRLKDITELFMDTGVGRDGYSIIGQGRVDEMLSSRSEDRRRIFEEAAGVAKLRVKKEEAVRRLIKTEENLNRVADVVNELEQQLVPLEKQAKVARTYLALMDVIKQSEWSLGFRQLEALALEKAKTSQQNTDLSVQRSQLETHINDLRQKLALTNQKLLALENQRIELEEANNSHQALKLALVADKTAHKEQAESILERLEDMKSNSESQNADLLTLENEIKSRQLALADFREERDTVQNELNKVQAEYDANLEVLAGLNSSVESLHSKLQNLQNEVQTTISNYIAVSAAIKAGDDIDATQRHDLEVLIHESDDIVAKVSELETGLTSAQANLLAGQTKLAETVKDLNEAQNDLDALNRQLTQLNQEKINFQYRLNTLSDLEKNYDGYSNAVQALLKQQGREPGVLGTVAELLAVPSTYDIAIEIALGGALQNIVVSDDRVASRLINYLKTNHLGRATFLPLQSLRSKPVDSKLSAKLTDIRGCLGLASDLVTTTKELETLKIYLLGNIFVAENMDVALYMAKEAEHRVRIVTLEGELLTPGGALTGGSLHNKRPKLLGRTREIKELEQKIKELPLAISELETEIKNARLEFIQATEDHNNLQLEIQDQDKSLAVVKSELAEAKRNFVAIDERKNKLQAQLATKADQRLQLQKELQELEQKQAELEALSETIQQKLQAENQISLASNLKQENLRELLNKHRLDLQNVEAKFHNEELWLLRLESDLDKRKTDLNSASEVMVSLANRLTTLQAETELILQQEQELETKAAALAKNKNDLALELKTLEADKESDQKNLQDLNHRQILLVSEAERLQTKEQRLVEKEDELRNHLWENYELTFEQIDTSTLDLTTATATLERKLNENRRQVRELGPVNACAVEEYDKVKERYDFLIAQRDDIQKARKSLDNLIVDLTKTMRERFSESFSKINSNFKEVFTALFGGGKAEVVYDEDVDILEANIEIKASPPGKRLQNMMLLSGGERSLTAIALLFAILNLRPTPFVVLDEIEAALDDANVLRFNDYVREHSRKSQFIMVTHRKGTMESCDRIYGVTMQERGVSRILSVQLTSNPDIDFVV